MSDIFQNAPKQSTDCPYGKKKKENLTLLSFLLVKLHQYLNYTVLVIRVGLGTWVFLLEPRTIITRAEDVAGWQQGPPVRRGAVLGFQGDIDVLWTNDQITLSFQVLSLPSLIFPWKEDLGKL